MFNWSKKKDTPVTLFINLQSGYKIKLQLTSFQEMRARILGQMTEIYDTWIDDDNDMNLPIHEYLVNRIVLNKDAQLTEIEFIENPKSLRLESSDNG